MNKILIVLLSIISSVCYSQSKNEIYPTNAGSEIVAQFDSLNKLNKLSEIDGKFYAFNAKITNVKKAYLYKPYFEIEFPDGKKIWIASLLKSDLIKENSLIKILGIFMTVNDDDDELAKKFNDKNYHILMFTFLDIASLKAHSFEGALGQAEQWRDGEIPKDLK